VAALKTAIEFYEGQARQYRHQLFGQSSEKSGDECAQNEGLNVKKAEDEVGPQPEADPYDSESKYLEYEVKAHKRRKRKGKREDDLSNMETVRIDYELPEGQRTNLMIPHHKATKSYLSQICIIPSFPYICIQFFILANSSTLKIKAIGSSETATDYQ
jgi:hypothetical protein